MLLLGMVGWVNAAAARTTLFTAARQVADRPAAAASIRPIPAADSAAAIQLLQRATFGIRPGDVDTVLQMGLAAWLGRQLQPERIDDRALEERLRGLPAANMTVAELMRAFPPPGVNQRPRRDSAMMVAGGNAPVPPSPGRDRAPANRSPQRLLLELVNAKLARAVYSQRQLQEVMTDFWFNHFNVFFGKGLDRYLVADYERNAIRPHVFGRFEDLLRATAQHPAMLFYLDNWTSSVPDSLRPGGSAAAARRRQLLQRIASLSAAQKAQLVRSGRLSQQQLERLEAAARAPQRQSAGGINENYARELMELHTLGVEGGYTQEDVINVARAFTGWTIQRGGAGLPRVQPVRAQGRAAQSGAGARAVPSDVTFVFRSPLHDGGEKVILGHTLPAGRGREDGEDVIHMLATAPATAHHIARELVEYFLADDPPADFVDRLAQIFQDSDGDLRAVTRALFTDPAFYAPQYRNNKVKTPFQLVASALRATSADVSPSRGLVGILRSLGQLPYTASAPTGFSLRSADWANSGAMLTRMNFGLALAAGRIDGVRIDGRLLLRESGAGTGPAMSVVTGLIPVLLPGVNGTHLEEAIGADLEQLESNTPAGSERGRAIRGLGLVLGSPEFQQH